MEFEGIFVDDLLILICKPNSGSFRETIVETLEEVSNAKDLGFIGNHDGCFAE